MTKATTVLIVASLFLVAAPPPTHALSRWVSNANDSGPGSLREAIRIAGYFGQVEFAPALDGQPIVLSSGPLVVSTTVRIIGRGPNNTIIDGDHRFGVFYVGSESFAEVELLGMTVRNARGYGIYSDDRVILKIRDTTISGASGQGTLYAGHGVINSRGMVVLENTTISANAGTGIFNLTGTLMSIDTCTLSDNGRSGIISSDSDVTIVRSAITGNISSLAGGVHAVNGTVSIENSTISGNSGTISGGITALNGVVTLENATVTCNSGGFAGGIFGAGSSSVTLKNSIVAHQGEGADCFGTLGFQSLGYNLDSDDTCWLTHPNDLPGRPALLLPLESNGACTQTCAPCAISPAIDAGGSDCGDTDQRGEPRPRDGDGDGDALCDIGAFEHQEPLQRGEFVGDIYDLILALIGSDNELVSPLQEAIQVLDDADPGNDIDALDGLQAFMDEVEIRRGSTLTDGEADALLLPVQRTLRVLFGQFTSEGGGPARVER